MDPSIRFRTTPPLTEIPLQETVNNKTLDECVQTLSQQLKTLQNANKNIQASQKKIVKYTKEIDKGKISIPKKDTSEIAQKLIESERVHSLSKYRISEAKKTLAAFKARIQGEPPTNPKIKQLSKLLDKLTEEVHQQDALALQKIEKDLSKITGHKVFNAIFRIKAVSTDKERRKVSDLRRDLENLTQKGLDSSLQPSVDELRLKLGRALMLGHGYRSQKDIPEFLALTKDSDYHEKNIDTDDAKLMRSFIREKYPLIEQKAQTEIAAAKRNALGAILFHKGREFSKKDLPNLLEAARQLDEAGGAISNFTVEQKAFLKNRNALGEAFLKIRGYKLPVDVDTYLRNVAATFPRLKKEDAVRIKYELSYLAEINKKDGKAQKEIYHALGNALLYTYGFQTREERKEFSSKILDMAKRKEIVLDRQELKAIYAYLEQEELTNPWTPSIDDLMNTPLNRS